jgi:hypothetical protein
MRKAIDFVLILAALLLTASPLFAVSTSHWTHQSEADFKVGTLHNVVVTNLGDVKLSRAVKSIKSEDPDVSSVNSLAQTPSGMIYAGTGPKGILLSVDDKGKVAKVATIEGAVNILSLYTDNDGGLLIGTGGEKGRVMRIAKPGAEMKELFSDADVQYIWALQQTPDGNIYAATGPVGEVVEVKPDGSHSIIYKSSEDNITSMISDGKDTLYLGTDPNGLVIRLNRKTKAAFVMYNATESEVTGLALDPDGNLYAATGEVSDRQSQPPAPGEAQPKAAGRPDASAPGTPIPPVPNPAPPAPVPNPNPGEPKPIPKKQSRLSPSSNLMHVLLMDDPDPGPGGGGGGGDDPNNPGGNSPGGDQPGAVQSIGAQKEAPTPPTTPSTPDLSQKPEGNAIYKIDKEGFVSEIFRQNLVIYSLILQGDVLLVGTGDEGNIYQVNPKAEETEVVAKVDAKQVMCLLSVKDGRVLIGLANTGGISALTGGYAPDGTYISPVLDATQVSRFGMINLHGQLPDATQLLIATRSGNVKDSSTPGWSDWTSDAPAVEYQKVAAPSARFLQYRLTFKTSNSSKTALVDYVDVAYQIPNLSPVIKSVKIGTGSDTDSNTPEAAGSGATPPSPAPAHADSSAKTAGTGTQTITWDASDADNDPLVYTLYFRLEEQGPWILLKDGLKDTTYDWDTKAVADGRYQIKVVASDAAANPPGEGKTGGRVSNFYVVNNTPPVIGDLVWKATGTDVKIEFRAQDATSPIASADYTVDSSENWQAVFPVDHIFDSLSEKVVFTLKDLTPGQHQVTIRVTDSRGNQALQTVFVKVDAPAAP